VYKPSRRAVVVAASFALGLSTVAPAAHAGFLDGGSSNSPTVEGVGLPVGGDVLGNLLGGDLLGGVLGEDGILGGVLGGGVLGQGLPLAGVLDGGLLDALPVGDLLGGGLLDALPVGDALGGDGGLLAGDAVVGLVPDLGILPGLGSINEILEAFSDSGSLVPGLQVLDEMGVLGALGSL
jgi:hypothetical protein